jgi:hypothetical protein
MACVACDALVAAGISATVLSLSGCYSLVAKPPSQVTTGAVVVAEISDVGRVALIPQIGSEIARIQGQMIAKSDSGVNVNVSEVRFLSGLSSAWQGQQVTLRPQDVKSLQERTYSKRRSVFAAIAIGGLAALAFVVAGFAGVFSGDGSPDKSKDAPPSS